MRPIVLCQGELRRLRQFRLVGLNGNRVVVLEENGFDFRKSEKRILGYALRGITSW